MSVWDDPEVRAGGDFIKFENIGDTVSGVIDAVRLHRFDDGKAAPQLLLTTDEGEEKTVTAGQVRLKAELAEKRPEAGDHITIKLSDIEKRAGGKTLKVFTVEVRPGAGAAPQAAPAPTPVAAPAAAPAANVDAAAAAAALAWLSPEQKAALGLV